MTWNGSLVVEEDAVYSSVFDLNAGATIGRVPRPQPTGYSRACALASDASGASVIGFNIRSSLQAAPPAWFNTGSRNSRR